MIVPNAAPRLVSGTSTLRRVFPAKVPRTMALAGRVRRLQPSESQSPESDPAWKPL